MRLRVLATLACFATAACEAPVLLKDGTFAFPEKGARGASVVGANGIEFHDRDDVPARVVHRAVDEPWRPAVGFILPKSGRFRETSKPTVIATEGLAVVLRPSDTRVPSWGGEVLMRVDVIAPAAPGTARAGERLAIVVDGSGADTLILLGDALDELGAGDRVSAFDAVGGSVALPMIPAADRSLAFAAVEQRLRTTDRRARDVAAALRAARGALGIAGGRRLLLLTDGASPPTPEVRREVEDLAALGVVVSAVATREGVSPALASAYVTAGGVATVHPDLRARRQAVRFVVPSAGRTAFTDVTIQMRGNPAPSHVLEASGGGVVWRLDAGELALGNVRSGESRTEVVRITVPPYVPNERFTFEIQGTAIDAQTGAPRTFFATIPCVYDDDIERIGESRNGDVIAYASALATVKRLDRAFTGRDVEAAGGVAQIARLHATSMALLARDTGDPAIAEQAELLGAVLSVVGN
jgi:hypothetical protein